MNICPCCSGKSLEFCCSPVIENHSAQTAEQLMRSRYTAYTQHNASYLLKTTHPKTRNQYNIEDIAQWARENQWQQLQILNTEKGTPNHTDGIVEFKAYYKDHTGRNQAHHERSGFLKENNKWYYTQGEINPVSKPLTNNSINRNDPCPCGSGRKYKKCCA